MLAIRPKRPEASDASTVPLRHDSSEVFRGGNRLRQLISGVVTLAHDGPAPSLVLTGFSSYCKRQLSPQAKAACQVAAVQPSRNTCAGVTKQIRDLGVGKDSTSNIY